MPKKRNTGCKTDLARETLLVRVALARSEEAAAQHSQSRTSRSSINAVSSHLGRDDDLGAVDVELLEDAAHFDLGLAVRVDLGAADKVQSVLCRIQYKKE